MKQDFIRAGKPVENDYIKSLNGTDCGNWEAPDEFHETLRP
jgi:hypothetical protein